jgi:hypothetical protein
MFGFASSIPCGPGVDSDARPPSAAQRDAILVIVFPRRIQPAARYLPWAVVILIILVRLSNYWGLHYGNTDDISTDYMRMTLPFRTMVSTYAASQSRIQWYVTVPFWAGAMRLANTPWYDIVNLSTFAASLLLPLIALRRYYFPPNILLLCATTIFATQPLLFSYASPYSNPLYMEVPIIAAAIAVILFAGSQGRPGRRWWLLPGCIATALAVCTYEAATILSLVIFGAYFLGSHAGRPWRTLPLRRDLQCVVIVLTCYAALYFSYRAKHPAAYGGVQATTSYLTLPAAAKVVGTLSSTSSIYAWFTRPQWAYYIDHDSDAIPIQARLSLRNATPSEIALALLTAGMVFYFMVSGHSKGSVLRLTLVAFAFWIAPNLAYPLTAKIAALVVNKQLFAYGGTPYSQIGFACAVAVVGFAVSRLRLTALRCGAAGILALFLGAGSLAASAFNRESGLLAREQAAKWKVIPRLAACAAQIPRPYLQNLAAPRMWKSATAGLSWGDVSQDELYWDAFAFKRYGVHMHLTKASQELPVQDLDFRLAKDGSLESVIVARSVDGRRFQELWLISADSRPDPPDLPAGAHTVVPCHDAVHALHVTGDDLKLGALTPLVSPAAAAVEAEPGLPALSPHFGVGQEQTFHLSLSPLDNGEIVKTVGLMFNGMQSGVDACYVFWDVLKRERRLVNDNGEDSVVVRSDAIGNRQCEFLPDGTDYASDGRTIDLTYHVRFRRSFAGLKQIYLFRKNSKGGHTGLKRMGWWWVE